MTRLGQLIRREARLGGAFLALGSLQFLIAMALVQLAYPGYSLSANYISDLGNSTLSPWSTLFNVSIQLLGLLGIAASVLVRSAFLPRTSARIGLAFLALASLGAFLVGTFPETATELNGNIHAYVSDLTFLGSGAALVFLGFAMLGDVRWELYGFYSVLSGLVTFAAIVGFVAIHDTSHVGLWERLIVAPVLLWGLVAGAHILRLPAVPPAPTLRRLA
jgi:hypothetical membrane protein